MQIDRRRFLTRVAALGCSAAASPLLTPIALAQGPGDARLVVIILRGAMDGLDVVRPVGDPALAGMRPGLLADAAFDADFYAFHPALAPLAPLWQSGEFGAVHAVSTPYRDKRSHFDGQDILEAGITGALGPHRDGWLNRLLQVMPGMTAETAYAIGHEQMLILEGDAASARWSPDARLQVSAQTRRLLDLVVHDDPLFREASSRAFDMIDDLALQADDNDAMLRALSDDPMMAQVSGGAHQRLARFAVTRLLGDSRIASFSLPGWDTHENQGRELPRALGRLSDTLLTLRAGLGPVWEKTAVLCMTEFGRTARQNNKGGTDHGTGGALLYAGGALRGGQVLGRWPGLQEVDLYDRRDLMPTADIRVTAGRVMQGLFGVSDDDISQIVFPGLDLGDAPSLLL